MEVHGAGAASNASSSSASAPPFDAAVERERVRVEFYASYDVMTGVRIAATLGGFFGLMVFLVVYKSRSKSVKALKDPKIVEMAEAAVAVEDAEEQERQLAAAFESAVLESARGSLARLSSSEVAYLRTWARNTRFASVGDASLLVPPRRFARLRGDSLPASVMRFEDQLLSEEIPGEIEDGECNFLCVPSDIRRLSNITCSSSGSSYLERRGSSIVCALPTLPPRWNKSDAPDRTTETSHRNPIDIKVIQATPELSPCVSERTLNATELQKHKLANDAIGKGDRKMAPLASMGSFGASISVDCPEYDQQSLGPDSVFANAGDDTETDDEIEQFSTDSDESVPSRDIYYNLNELKDTKVRFYPRSNTIRSESPATSPTKHRHHSCITKPLTKRTLRRLSHPTIVTKPSCATISATVQNSSPVPNSSEVKIDKPSACSSLIGLHVKNPEKNKSKSLDCRHDSTRNVDSTELSSKSGSPLNLESISWSQETLF